VDDPRETVKKPLHKALHDLDVVIPGVPAEGCHCNLVAEVALDAAMPVVLAALAEAQSTVADLLRKRDSWQRRCEEATVRNGQLAAALAEVQRERDEARRQYDEACQVLANVRESLELVGSNFDKVDADLAAARADNDRMRPVLNAARTWREVAQEFGAMHPDESALAAAVDTYESQESTE
jgi:chromosome segregation ATPase